MAKAPATGKRAMAKAEKEAAMVASSFATVVVDAENAELKYVTDYLKGNTNLLFRLFASMKYDDMSISQYAVLLHAVCNIQTMWHIQVVQHDQEGHPCCTP
jgi:hypothetical protein